MVQAAIELRGVTRRYGGQLALTGADLVIGRGVFVALVGGSGSGKTTLLKTINRLGPADAGQVLIEGDDVALVELHDLRRRVGYVFQEIGLFPHLTVAENIAITPKLLGWEPARRAARVAELLQLVGLPAEMGSRPPAALSGGQQQRVGVARALAAQPAIVLMDEPFGALDPLTRDALGQDYRALHDKLGLTTVMVTHDMTEAVLLADRIVVLEAGRVIGDGTAAELSAPTADPRVCALLEAPQRQARRLRAKLTGVLA